MRACSHRLTTPATCCNVAVDVGGTFTDVLVFDEETGGLTEGKVLSTPENPSKGWSRA
jgi:N-methylhydantoinase A/oxoprolinase/acetone carboxylase beta subunit